MLSYFINEQGAIGTAHGSALVKLGHTTVVAGVKAEVGVPPDDSPGKGFLGMCTPS